MPMSRPGSMAGFLAVLVLLAAPALPGAAGIHVAAHAQLVASSPGAGVRLDDSPAELRLVFSERLEPQITSADLAGIDGAPVLARAGSIDPADPYALVVPLPPLGEGVYTVTWRTLSADDGHTAEGFFSFAIGDTEAALPAGGHEMAHDELDPVRVIGRWLTYAGLLGALGVAAFWVFVIRGGLMPRRLVRVLAGGLVVSALAGVGVALLAAFETDAFPAYLLETRNGTLQLARAAVAGLGAAALLVGPPRSAAAMAAGTGLAGIVLLVFAGHAAAVPGPVALLGHAIHVAAAAVWIGGVIGLLALVFRPALFGGETPGLRTLVPRFSALALVSIGLVALSGAYAAWTHTGVILDVETEYGRRLLLKSVIAAGAIGLGGLNYLDGGRLVRWLPAIRWRLSLEAAGAAAVLLVTAALAITPPVETPRGVAIEPIPDAFGVIAPGMAMEIVPGRPGVNRVVVTTTDALAAGPTLDLVLERVDDGSSTRVPLVLEPTGGSDHGPDTHGMTHRTPQGTVAWSADALVFPAGSTWDTSVRVLIADGGTEVSRQRFAFSLSDDGISSGTARALLDPGSLTGIVLLVGGAVAIGLGIGGLRLPRCDPRASRLALIVGGVAAALLGGGIGLERTLGL